MIAYFAKKLEDLSSKWIPVVIYVIAAMLALVYIVIYFILILVYHGTLENILFNHPFVVSVLFVYALCVIWAGYHFFDMAFLGIVFFPLVPIEIALVLYWDRQVRAYLSENEVAQNNHAPAVVVVTYLDRLGWKGWLKQNVRTNEIKAIIEYLKVKGRDCSFYLHASVDDVRTIVQDRGVKEVCFVGHGGSHFFRLSSEQELYYCDFKEKGYTKELVHQMHCGDEGGKGRRLIDYVVPPENRETCFGFEKKINESIIIEDLKQRTERLKRGEKEV